MKKAFKLFMFILIGAAFAFNFASCDDISFTYRRHRNEGKGDSQSLPFAKLNAGDIFLDQDEELYLKVNYDGYIDFYYWDVDTYSYEKYVSNAYYNIDNSKITITCPFYDYYDGYYTDTLTGSFDGTTMTLFDEDGYHCLTLTKVTSVQGSLKTATNFSTITLENNYSYNNNHAMIEWIASDNKYKLNAGQKIKFTIRGINYDTTVSNKRLAAVLVDTTNGWRELSNYANDQYGRTLNYSNYFEAVFIIELTSTPFNASAEACKLELSVGELYDTQSDITIYVSDFKAELLE